MAARSVGVLKCCPQGEVLALDGGRPGCQHHEDTDVTINLQALNEAEHGAAVAVTLQLETDGSNRLTSCSHWEYHTIKIGEDLLFRE